MDSIQKVWDKFKGFPRLIQIAILIGLLLLIFLWVLIIGQFGKATTNTVQPTAPKTNTEQSTSPAKTTPPPAKPAFNDKQYRADVQALIDSFNAAPDIINSTGTVQVYIEDSGTPATVDIGMDSLTFWSISSDAQKKEYMTIIGKNVGDIATANGSDIQPYVEFYSANGVKLGEFTTWGNANIEK